MFSIFLVFCVYQSLFSFPIGVAILSKKIIGLCRPSFLLFSSSSARPHKIDSKSDDAIETSLKAPLIQESLQSGNNSVHLKLIKDFGSGDNESKSGSIAEEITSQNETMSASILQYIINETGEVVVATLEEAGWEILDHFSIHKLGFNLSSTPGYSRRELTVNLEDDVAVNSVLKLWTDQKFLGRSKEFPLHLANKIPLDKEESVDQFIRSHVRRLKAIKREPQGLSVIFQSFLRARNISGNVLSYYVHDPARSRDETMTRLKQFLIWFRSEFPYYYDKCMECSHSGGNKCYGVVYPTESESEGLAGRTELYLCSQCNTTTRFPRFNDVTRVLRTRRGRCGEYSVLMMRLLQALGYRARWTVDKADHVWTEVQLPRSKVDGDNTHEWVHVDPCEASIDEPLIYQGWGKNQTYIFSYSVDPVDANQISAEDVTALYTTDKVGMDHRRGIDGVNQTYINTLLQEAVLELKIPL